MTWKAFNTLVTSIKNTTFSHVNQQHIMKKVTKLTNVSQGDGGKVLWHNSWK